MNDLYKKLFESADELRKNIDAAEYKHVVLGLVFLKFISDKFETNYNKLKKEKNADPDDPDEYISKNIFYLPKESRWSFIVSNARQPDIGNLIDDALLNIEKINPSLDDVLPKVFSRSNLDQSSLGQLIDRFNNIEEDISKTDREDFFGEIYEYFLGEFAFKEGKKGGQYYTPRSLVSLMINILKPVKGRIFDPACGSGGMFVNCEKFLKNSLIKNNNISIYGQESNQTTWKLCKMNLAIRGIDSTNVLWNADGSFLNNAHPDLKADYIIANPPFNDKKWGASQLAEDIRFKYGIPSDENANFAWVQHFIYHLNKTGKAAFILGRSAISAERTDLDIRKQIVNSGILDSIMVLQSNLFYNTQIPASIWILDKTKAKRKNRSKEEVLLMDLRAYGTKITSTLRVLNDNEINQIGSVYDNWVKGNNYKDKHYFSKSVTISQIEEKNYNLSVNKYIETKKIQSDKKATLKNLIGIKSKALSTQNQSEELQKKIIIGLKKTELDHLSNLNFISMQLDQLHKFNYQLFNLFFIDGVSKNKKFNYTYDLLNDVADIKDCLHSKKPDENLTSEKVLLEVSNIKNHGLINLDETYNISLEDYKKWTSNIELKKDDLVITNAGRVGAIGKIPFGWNFATGRNMTAVRIKDGYLKNEINATYLLNYFLSEFMHKETYLNTDLSTVLDTLNVKGIRKIKVLVPEKKYMKLYNNIALPLRDLIELKNNY